MTKVRNIMSTDLEVVRPEATIKEAAELMRRVDIGVLPVCDGERLEGMITDRDIVVRGIAEDRDFHYTSVRDIMSKQVYYCFEDESVEDAAKLMQRRQVRRLVVLDRNKRLKGIVALKDLSFETGDEKLAGETLKAVSEPGHGLTNTAYRAGRGVLGTAGTLFGVFGFFGALYFLNQQTGFLDRFLIQEGTTDMKTDVAA